jgi:hypothetical protein
MLEQIHLSSKGSENNAIESKESETETRQYKPKQLSHSQHDKQYQPHYQISNRNTHRPALKKNRQTSLHPNQAISLDPVTAVTKLTRGKNKLTAITSRYMLRSSSTSIEQGQ